MVYPYSYGWPGFGRGFGFGRGWGWACPWPRYSGVAYPYSYGWPWAMPKEQEIGMLEDQERWLSSELDAIRKRLEELKK